MTAPNVLRVNSVEERTKFREAVSDILLTIQRDHSVTLHDIAERIDVSLGTVSNAANRKADLSSVFLNRLACAYGPATLDPFARLSGGRMVPVQADGEADVLPFLTMATHRVVSARTPNSPGGVSETLREQLDYLPDLRRLQREVESLICRIENRKDAA